MADRFPIILNTSANQLQEIASGDTLDVSGAGVKANLVDSLSVVGTGVSIVGVVTATSADINGDLDVDGHTNLDNVSIAGVVTATTINATTFAGALVGNSATATKLATARTIGGVSFDGTANINLPGVNASGNQDTSGNAATATALQNARTIGGVSFNGTANINLPGVNASGNQDTSGTAAVATNVTVSANNSTNETVYPVFVDGATGSQGAETDTGLTYNPSTGNLSATTFTGNTTGTIQTAAQPNITSVGTLSSLNVSGNVSIGGTLTYEDVTNIDSIGIVTARSGLVSPYADIDDFVSVGSNIHLGNAGIITASSYRGDGSQLTGVTPNFASIASNVVADSNNTRNLGTSSNSWKKLYISDNILFKGANSSNSQIVCVGDLFALQNQNSGGYIDIRNHNNHGLRLNSDAHLIPHADGVIDLGLTGTRFRAAYVDTYYGDGSNLTGISVGVPGISTTGISTFRDVQVGGAMTCTGTIVNKIDATTENAVIIGFEANKNNTNTDGSVIIGHRAGYQNATGKGYNTFLGYYAGYAGGGTQGAQNVMVGSGCGMFMYDNASYNAAIGVNAGYYVNANYTVSIGANSNISRGEFNTAIGGYAYGAGNQMNSNYMTYPSNTGANQWGDNNIVIGYQANLPDDYTSNYIVIGNKKNTNFVVGTLGVEVTAGVTTHAGSVVVGAGVSAVGIVTALNFVKTDGTTVGGAMTGYNNDPGENNVTTFIAGRGAGNNIQLQNSDGQSAHGNVLIGDGAGRAAQNGYDYNVSIGSYANYNLRDGLYNVSIGYGANRNVSTQNSSNTIAIGYETLINFTGGGGATGNNTVVGHGAALSLVQGANNLVLGYYANTSSNSVSNEITLGNNSINHLRVPGIGVSFSEGGAVISGIVTATNFVKADGSAVGGVTSDAQENTVGGTNAGDAFSGTNALENTLFGYDAGTDITSGDYNTAFGATALPDCTTGYGNVAIGRRTLFKVTSGYNNTGTGFQAGEKLTTGYNNVAIGAYSLYKATTANNNVALGNNAMNETTTGDENTAVGQGSLHENQTGEYNVAIGQNALAYSHNNNQTAAGYKAGYNSNGNNNTYIGSRTGYSQSNSNGNYNSALGSRALQNNNTGKENVAIGYDAGYTNSSGDENIFIGEKTGYSNTTANRNTFVGRKAGESNTTGTDNVFYGWRAGDNVTTGSNNIVIGAGVDASAATVSNEVTIGDSNITTFRVPGIGFNASGTGHLDVTGNSARFRTIESGGATVEIRSGGSEGYVGTGSNHKVSLITNSTRRWEISGAGHFIPYANNTYDIGSSSYRVRNLYTNDLNLSNEGSKNDVDGTWGNYTIQEGESDLFLINKRNGKKYKFNLTEVS